MKKELLKLLHGTDKEKIERVNQMLFNIEMVDSWSKREKEMHDALSEIKQEFEERLWKKKN